MAQDKEKIKELNRRIKDLETALELKNQNLHDYQDLEKIADDKIRGLNAIHAEKIRSLMNSIQTLKKENASMGKATKEHKRSEYIQQLNKEIGEQDTVIEVLRGMLPDQKKADTAIIQTLSKGPARIRVSSREELKMEIKDLKGKLLKFEKKKGQNTAEAAEEKTIQLQDEPSIISAKLHEVRQNVGNAEYIMKINELNNVVEDLNLAVAGKQTEVDKYKQLISKKNEEIIELTQSKVDLKFMITKNEELKNELDALQKKMNADLYANYDQSIKLQEIELAATIHKNLQNKTNESIKLEIENLQNKLVELLTQNKQLAVTNTKLKDETGATRKLLEDAKERNRKLNSEHEEQVNRLTLVIKEKENNVKVIQMQMMDYDAKFDKLTVEIRNRDAMIADLEIKIAELEEQINQYHAEEFHRTDEQNQPEEKPSSRNNLDISILEAKKQEYEREVNILRQENYRLRERVKELTRIEIELSDRVDMLEQENRFMSKKVIAANLINKEVYSDSVKYEDMQAYLKEAAQRYETRIKQQTGKIKELEMRNKELEDIQNIMQNPSVGSMQLSEHGN